ncbi:MAG: sigma-70 family RNA polymerase sigma factor [Clostridia bacterium]|nr:sigma-70 family RNA polymerase sigma factor [Clostridia bacterium]
MPADPAALSLLQKAQNGEKAAGDELIARNLGLVRSLVRRFTGRGAEPEELYQVGLIGLYKAILSFDPAFGTAFSTYAVPKIEGELRRYLRDGGSVRFSRSLRERAFLVRRTEEELSMRLGRAPRLSELSARLSLSPAEIAETESFFRGVDSLDREVGEDGSPLGELLPGGESEEALLDRLSLREAIGRLPGREAKVIRLLFHHGLTQTQAAALLKTSQVQISRIRKKALDHLRELLDET